MNYSRIDSIEEFKLAILSLKAAKWISFDIETSGFRYVPMRKVLENKRKGLKILDNWDVDHIIGISFSYEEGQAYYIPLWVKGKHWTDEHYQQVCLDTNDELPIGNEVQDNDYYFWFGVINMELVLSNIKMILEDETINKIAQNGKFDIGFLKAKLGINVASFKHDTMLAAHTLDENTPNDLDYLSRQFKDLSGYKSTVYDRLTKEQQENESYADIDLEVLALYGCKDADATFRLKFKQDEQFKQEEDEKRDFISEPRRPKRECDYWMVNSRYLFDNFYMPLSNAYVDAEIEGIPFDIEFAEMMAEKYKKDIDDIQKWLDDLLKRNGIEQLNNKDDRWINLGSPKQKQELFFIHLGWPVFKMTDTAKKKRIYQRGDVIKPEHASTDKDHLKRILVYFLTDQEKWEVEIELIERYLEWSNLSKMLSTYLEGKKIYNKLDQHNRMHYSMKLHGTVSGRLSSSPNVQNLPRKTKEANIRGIFTAPEGAKVFSADLSQAELRIMADYANDETMLRYIEEKIDIHWEGCQIIFELNETQYDPENPELKRLRKLTKLCNFGGLYGGSDDKKVQSVNEKLGINEKKITMKIAQKHTEWFNQTFPRIQQYLKEMDFHIRKNGWIDNVFGRRRRLPDAFSTKKYLQAEAVRQGINAQIQGTASDIVQFAYIKVCNWVKEKNLKSRALWTVHDEIDGYVYPEEEELFREMVPKFMTEKIAPIDRIKVPLESEFEIFKNRWGD